MTGPPPAAGPLPGTPVTDVELRGLGFTPHAAFRPSTGHLARDAGLNWATLGDVPDSPAYAFTVSQAELLHVTYVGLTTQLWMVTKGHLPRSGGARGGQRYGRPKHAGITRKRINALTTLQVAAGRTVTHWLAPTAAADIAMVEEQLIGRWNVRATGWNRG